MSRVSLASYISKNRGQISNDAILTFSRWLFTEVADLHLIDIVQRNISPESILVSPDFEVYEFGSDAYRLKSRFQLRDAYSWAEPSVYTAPELFNFSPLQEVTPQRLKMADVWSAVVTVRALTDEPLTLDDVGKVIEISSLSPVVEAVVEGLALNPDERATAAQIRDLLHSEA